LGGTIKTPDSIPEMPAIAKDHKKHRHHKKKAHLKRPADKEI
jgi:hypothetical protein